MLLNKSFERHNLLSCSYVALLPRQKLSEEEDVALHNNYIIKIKKNLIFIPKLLLTVAMCHNLCTILTLYKRSAGKNDNNKPLC